MEKKDKLKFNLDFLGEDLRKKSDKKTDPSTLSRKTQDANETNKKISSSSNLIAGVSAVVILLIITALAIGWTEDDSAKKVNIENRTTPTSPNSDSVVIGEYTCSRYHYNQAVALDPDESESQITSAQSFLSNRADEIERLKDEIEGSNVNEYSSQWKIDQYNGMIDEYNSKLALYNREVAVLDSRIDRYNTQIEVHNSYLMDNCSPNR